MSGSEMGVRSLVVIALVAAAKGAWFFGERLLAPYVAATTGFNNDASQFIAPELAQTLPAVVAALLLVVAIVVAVPVVKHLARPTVREDKESDL